MLGPDGVAVFVTPNRLTLGRPDEIIDPYHYVEFDRGRARALCAQRFSEVEVLGLFGSPRYMEIFDAERATLDRLLGRDPLRLRRLVPMRAKQRLYDMMLQRHRSDARSAGRGDHAEDFELARRPRRGARRLRSLHAER